MEETTQIVSLNHARQLDETDPIRSYREKFHLPIKEGGQRLIYLCGNSLGLQPKTAKSDLETEIINWQKLGVEGHFQGKTPWVKYHEKLAAPMAKIVGAQAHEVTIMNTLTVNLHLMMVSFYNPSGNRKKILIEADAFPSDRYAAESQIRWHGLSPEDCLIELKAREGEALLRHEDIIDTINAKGDEIALILLGNTNYYTGQFFDIKAITKAGHAMGCKVGFDCAHGAGNVPLDLHNAGCDFAVWCTYKYINAGPGSIAAAFIHERHLHDKSINRLEGWWGHNKQTRFEMRGDYDPIPTAEGWQLSCQPIFSLVPIWSSLRMFDEIGFDKLRQKSIKLTSYLESLVTSLGEDIIDIITPSDPEARGAQLSIRVKNSNKELFDKITASGVIVDWREPDVIRVAPTPLYNSFEEVYKFYIILKALIQQS